MSNNVNTPVVELYLNNFNIGVISPSKKSPGTLPNVLKVTLNVPFMIISIVASLSMQFKGSEVRCQIVKNLPNELNEPGPSVANADEIDTFPLEVGTNETPLRLNSPISCKLFAGTTGQKLK